MKKIIGLIILLFSFVQFGQAQVQPQAIGLRLGGHSGATGAEISYQHGLSASNRVELDLGFGANRNHSRIQFTAIYHWVWNIDGGLNWYIGPGASLGLYSYDANHKYYNDYGDGYINASLGGQIGLEYKFSGIPLQISLDTRPMWDFIGDRAGLGWGGALGIRYIF